jgi:NADPH:quinone reductase-like Zn-dependent oxidoreductase
MARRFNRVTPRTFTMPGVLWLISRADFGWRRPRKPILGSAFSGVVEAVGSAVTRFKVGDEVFGYPGSSFGANAEYLCMRQGATVAIKPANMSHVEASTVPYGGLTALSLLKAVDIQPGQEVLINGASGGIGSYAVQLAKHYGATVTGVCGTRRMPLVKALGADHVIDYTREDFAQNGETYDLILDVLGKSSFSRVKGSLTEKGVYFPVSFKTPHLAQMLWTRLSGGKRVNCTLAMEKPEDLDQIRELVEAGAIKTVVDRCYPLAETAEAHRYLESGQHQGSVVIVLTKEGEA